MKDNRLALTLMDSDNIAMGILSEVLMYSHSDFKSECIIGNLTKTLVEKPSSHKLSCKTNKTNKTNKTKAALLLLIERNNQTELRPRCMKKKGK